MGSSKCVCFFELDRPSDLELARLRFNVFEEPDRLSDFNSELSPPPSPSPSVADSFLVVVGTSSFSYFRALRHVSKGFRRGLSSKESERGPYLIGGALGWVLNNETSNPECLDGGQDPDPVSQRLDAYFLESILVQL